jgi:predicted AAA+ superfamily ATPase
MIQRSEIKELTARLKEPRKFIQVIVGPRQVGKTTMVTQAMEQLDISHLFFSRIISTPLTNGWQRSGSLRG